MAKISIILFFSCLALLLVNNQVNGSQRSGNGEEDLVNGLSGDGSGSTVNYDNKWYAGILDLSNFLEDQPEQERVYYWFFPSQKNDTQNTDPLLLWLNGGPGCSSLIGALTENGPFIFKEGQEGQNYNNQYSWNKEANVLYIESPGGVGFSQSDIEFFDDNSTAYYNLAALQSFYEKFPDYRDRPLYIAGESYAGIYIPYLADLILKKNEGFAPKSKIQLKGIAIGNGATLVSEVPALYGLYPQYKYEYLFDAGITSDDIDEGINLNCDYDLEYTDECKKYIQAAEGFFAGINLYNIDGKCWPTANYLQGAYRQTKGQNANKPNETPQCSYGAAIENFLNDQNVRSKINAEEAVIWTMCSETVNSTYKSLNGSYFLYPGLVKSGLRIWIFSGDRDAAVSIVGTFAWINKLREEEKLNDLVPYTPWYYQARLGVEKENGGDFWRMDGLTFVRFKGAGHMVPTDNPQGAYEMLSAFLAGKNMDIVPPL